MIMLLKALQDALSCLSSLYLSIYIPDKCRFTKYENNSCGIVMICMSKSVRGCCLLVSKMLTDTGGSHIRDSNGSWLISAVRQYHQQNRLPKHLDTRNAELTLADQLPIAAKGWKSLANRKIIVRKVSYMHICDCISHINCTALEAKYLITWDIFAFAYVYISVSQEAMFPTVPN